MKLTKATLLMAGLPLVFAGCTGTNPNGAFADVDKTVTARTGATVKWARDDMQRSEASAAVGALLQTNLTAQSAVTVALLNNRSLQAGFEEIGISQADLAQAARLKNIEIVGSWRFPNRPPSIADAEYSAAGDFLDLLTLPARKYIARRALEQTKLRVADSVLRLAADAQSAFYTAQAGENLARRFAVITEVNDAAADVAERQRDAGNINDLELHNQQAAAAQAQLDLAMARAKSRADRERLNRVLGLTGEQVNWKMADELPALPETDAPLENLETLAVAQRLDLAAMRNDAESVSAAMRLKNSTRFLPGVRVGVDTERSPDGQRVTGPTLGLEVPIFDQGQPAMARLSAQYRQVQDRIAAMEVNVRSEVRQARDAMLAARAAAEQYANFLLPQRQQILRETLLHYNAMEKSSYELLAAKEREQTAERGSIEALRDYWIARAELERAVGGRLHGDGSPRTDMPKVDTNNTDIHQHNH